MVPVATMYDEGLDWAAIGFFQFYAKYHPQATGFKRVRCRRTT